MTFLTLRFAILILTAAACSAPACAQPAIISLPIDEVRILRLARPAALIISGNPAIADVASDGGAILVITGKSVGETNVIALDAGGAEIAEAQVHVGAPANSVALYQGGKRQTLYCAPICEKMASPGDDAAQFNETAGAASRKLDMGRAAARPD